MEHYLGVAEQQGISSDEVGAVQAIVMAVSAGKIEAQLREVKARKNPAAVKEGHDQAAS
jgi:hypothetical protein